jgi:6-pyruvoyltetrahydropterin/6-carboxytetrahydropterin synthase
MILRREYRFEASHILPRHPGKCSQLHGHSYRFIVTLEGPIEPEQGMVIDFGDLDAAVTEQVINRVDHRHWNDILDNPTAEWISVWIWGQLEDRLPGLVSIELFEVEGASVVYSGQHEEGS